MADTKDGKREFKGERVGDYTAHPQFRDLQVELAKFVVGGTVMRIDDDTFAEDLCNMRNKLADVLDKNSLQTCVLALAFLLQQGISHLADAEAEGYVDSLVVTMNELSQIMSQKLGKKNIN